MLKNLLLLSAVLLISACSSTSRSYFETLKFAFQSSPDVELTLEQIKQADYDFLYVKHGSRPQAVMTLAFIENGQHKWVSADKALLIMENGRIVRTVGLDNDLLHLTNTVSDPIKLPLKQIKNQSWLRLADWQKNEYGYQVHSMVERHDNQQITVLGHTFNTIQVVENVEYNNDSAFLRLDRKWQNIFWFDTVSGKLIKSQQTLAPFGELFLIVHISQAARLIN